MKKIIISAACLVGLFLVLISCGDNPNQREQNYPNERDYNFDTGNVKPFVPQDSIAKIDSETLKNQ